MPGCCDATNAHFGAAHAKRDLKRYRTKGPDVTTQFVIDGLRALGLRDMTLLDIGTGIGIINHELMRDICVQATLVDMSSAYLEAAFQEAERQGYSENIRFIQGDLVSRSKDLPVADFVTLDRVVCCYPDFPNLLANATARCRRALGMVYPRDRLPSRIMLALYNLKHVLKRDPFRAFIHPVDEIEAQIRDAGFETLSEMTTLFWKSVVFVKREDARA